MKRKYLIALVPILAATTLFGCGKDHSAAEVQTKFQNMINTYTSGPENKTNSMFSLKSDSTEEKFKSILYPVYSGNNASGTLSYYVTTNGEFGSSFQITHRKINQLNTIYQRELSMIFNYYETYKSAFYSEIASAKPDKKELNALYEKMYDLNSQVSKLNETKASLELDVKQFTTNSTLIDSSIESYCHEMNKTIEKSLGFVGKFKEMHKKYFFKNYTEDEVNLKQMYNEALYYTAEIVYLNNIKIYDKNNNCNIQPLLGLRFDANGSISSSNVNDAINSNLTLIKDLETGKSAYQSTAMISAGNVTITKVNSQLLEDLKIVLKEESTAEVKQAKANAVAKVNNLKQMLEIFKQYLGIYKNSYNDLNLNYLVKEIDGKATDADIISVSDKHVLELYKIMGSERTPELFNAIINVI